MGVLKRGDVAARLASLADCELRRDRTAGFLSSEIFESFDFDSATIWCVDASIGAVGQEPTQVVKPIACVDQWRQISGQNLQ